MVVAYKVDALSAQMRFLLNVPSVVLANLVLEENAFPELLQEDCTPDKLAAALEPLLRDTPERRAQLAALARIPRKMLIDWQRRATPPPRSCSTMRRTGGGTRENGQQREAAGRTVVPYEWRPGDQLR